MPRLDSVRNRMRDDWDWRAREDALFYVAFGRRGQSRDEFLSTAEDVLHVLRQEFRRFPPGTDFQKLTALEIGCGPGRLMLPLSEVFGRMQGVDISGEMIALARQNLDRVPHAEVRQNNGADLRDLENESIDFCYSFAVFQHIPDKEVVWSYLREACRVLKVGGILKCQFNGIPWRAPEASPWPAVTGWSERACAAASDAFTLADENPDTWHGVSFCAEELAAFAADHGLQLLAMDRFDTQYLWLTARKAAADAEHPPMPAESARIVRVTNTFTGDAVVAQSGRYAGATVWVLGLPEHADLNNLHVLVDGERTAACFIGKQVWTNPTQVNVYLPPGVRSGILPVQLALSEEMISNRASMRVIPAGPWVPRLAGVTDAVNLLSPLTIESRAVKVKIEEAPYSSAQAVRAAISAQIDGAPLKSFEVVCLDPLPRLYQIDLSIPDAITPGSHQLTVHLGRRRFSPIEIQIPEPAEGGHSPT